MKGITIRNCTLSDCNDIFLLNKNELGYKYEPEKTKYKLAGLLKRYDNKIFVAVVDGKIAGYVHAVDYDVLYAPHMKNIMGIAVAEEYRMQGIGKALLNEIEKWAKETGAEGVRLVSGAERKEAHEFYRCCGYRENKSQVNFKKYLHKRPPI